MSAANPCPKCGEEVAIRWVGGRRVPIGCKCRTAAGRGECQTAWYKTKCPKCQDDPVYFLRHNGGSVWLNAMGYPWPRHEKCFPRTRKEEESPIDDLFASLPKSDGFVLVTVKSATDGDLVFADAEGIESVWRALPGVACGFLRGGIVVFSKEKKLIVDWDGDTYVVRGPLAACPHCRLYVWPELLETHIREEHPARVCPRCGERIPHGGWLAHQAKHLEPEIPNC